MNWRTWILLILLFGPILAYVVFGGLWLTEKGWLLPAVVGWIAAYTAFAILANRWTKERKPILPPIDWDTPHTFTSFDRKAWDLVQEEAKQGDTLSFETLTSIDIYIETGRRLAERLAQHYHPRARDPIEHMPVVEMLTALELAAEDLGHLCREVPGGDLITPAHYKKAVQAAGYFQRANDLYTMVLPFVQPWVGIPRYFVQKMVVAPSWKSMQQNLLRWFFRAYVNRLGTHLIELYSGRLSIGADQYRHLTRRSAREVRQAATELAHLSAAVVGARDSGKSVLIEAVREACEGDLEPVKRRLEAAGFDETVAERLRTIAWVEVPGFTVGRHGETARDRATRRDAVEAATEADLLVLVIASSRTDLTPEVKFLDAWYQWFADQPGLEPPPVLVVLTGVDRDEDSGQGIAESWAPPYDWMMGRRPLEVTVRARLQTVRNALPSSVGEPVAVGLGAEVPFGVVELLLPALATRMHQAERIALIRYFHRQSMRSKAGRLISQVGRQSRRLWKHLRGRPSSPEPSLKP